MSVGTLVKMLLRDEVLFSLLIMNNRSLSPYSICPAHFWTMYYQHLAHLPLRNIKILSLITIENSYATYVSLQLSKRTQPQCNRDGYTNSNVYPLLQRKFRKRFVLRRYCQRFYFADFATSHEFDCKMERCSIVQKILYETIFGA